MRIGILKTGSPPSSMDVPSYPAMIATALGSTYTYRAFDVAEGDIPSEDPDVDAYIITGSPSGVHDQEPWIRGLRAWLRDVDPGIPLIGICFGQHIMAQAYGGHVETWDKGWALGLHKYEVMSREKWMDTQDNIVLPASHRDQVVVAPPNTRVIARSEFCPHAVLAYDDRRAISFQAHPEFSIAYTAMLIDRRERLGQIDGVLGKKARESLQKPDDRERVISWIRAFFVIDPI